MNVNCSTCTAGGSVLYWLLHEEEATSRFVIVNLKENNSLNISLFKHFLNVLRCCFVTFKLLIIVLKLH